MVENRIYRIFKRGSRTYFYNSLFFPKEVREDVFILYSFVREADNFVDAVPQKKDEFCEYFGKFCKAWDGERSGDLVLDGFVEMAKRKKFEKEWIKAFLCSMEMDLTKKHYDTVEEVNEYVYGSAEVVGLMMCRILGVNDRFFPNARALGKAMQYINFIRDIHEDNRLGRTYIPTSELQLYGLKDLREETARKSPECFSALIDHQMEWYLRWQSEAEKGYGGLDRNVRIPVMNASDMYKWTAMKILRDPMIVYRKKVKPSKARIVLNLLKKKVSVK
ncbi:MAG: phytoene/squalene synthase family protein [Candidatus Thermoplasmatota archaeon]|nr:phytoene/squalene synthase family protein [Candidatus Thermoplasmatota archaeon]